MKRRDFLKQVAVGGAMSVGAVHANAAPFGSSPTAPLLPADRNKVVFISDIHLNADAGVSWILNHLPDLADFLMEINARADVSELVIIGDLLDDWVRPYEEVPESFEQIITASHNAEVIGALQAICQNPSIQVTYLTGNHDLLSFEADNKALIASTFPNMNIISESPGLGAYARDSVIWAEHGHRYTLFNAPDIWSRPGGYLPLGYFVSRLAATQSVAEGKLYTTPDVLADWITKTTDALNQNPLLRKDYPVDPHDEGTVDDALILAIFNGIALASGARPWEKIVMSGKDQFSKDPRVEQVAIIYNKILSQWPIRQNIVNNDLALWNEVGYMARTADMLLEMPKRLKDLYPFAPRIVLFGHTHKAVFELHHGSQDSVYINTGTWIDSKPMTWAEIEIQDQGDQRSYSAALWYRGESTPRQSATIQVEIQSAG